MRPMPVPNPATVNINGKVNIEKFVVIARESKDTYGIITPRGFIHGVPGSELPEWIDREALKVLATSNVPHAVVAFVATGMSRGQFDDHYDALFTKESLAGYFGSTTKETGIGLLSDVPLYLLENAAGEYPVYDVVMANILRTNAWTFDVTKTKFQSLPNYLMRFTTSKEYIPVTPLLDGAVTRIDAPGEE